MKRWGRWGTRCFTAEDHCGEGIKALTPIENFNEFFDSEFSDDEFDTVGGLVMSAFGHLPKRNETTEIGAYRFRILNADSRRIHLLRLTPIAR